MKKPLVINLTGGPGVGKSGVRGGVFERLKWAGVSVDESPEFVKPKVYEEAMGSIKNQVYVFGKQHNQLYRLRNKVDVIVTDSPLFHNILYLREENPLFVQFVMQEFNYYPNLTFLLKRDYAYDPVGRTQDEEGAKEVDKSTIELLNNHKIDYIETVGGPKGTEFVFDKVMTAIKYLKNV